MLYFIMWLHLLAEFYLQSREMAKNKSTNILVLFKHACIIFITFFLGIGLLSQFFYGTIGINVFKFSLVNSIVHIIIDGSIWNVYKWMVKIKLEKTISAYYTNDDPCIKVEDIESRLKEYKFWEDPKFFDTIGVDQCLHISTLILLWSIYLK